MSVRVLLDFACARVAGVKGCYLAIKNSLHGAPETNRLEHQGMEVNVRITVEINLNRIV